MTDASRGLPVFCSWSGGKDSALALYEAVRDGAEPRFLVSMMIESGQRSRSHGSTARPSARRLELEAGDRSLRDGVWFVDLRQPSSLSTSSASAGCR